MKYQTHLQSTNVPIKYNLYFVLVQDALALYKCTGVIQMYARDVHNVLAKVQMYLVLYKCTSVSTSVPRSVQMSSFNSFRSFWALFLAVHIPSLHLLSHLCAYRPLPVSQLFFSTLMSFRVPHIHLFVASSEVLAVALKEPTLPLDFKQVKYGVASRKRVRGFAKGTPSSRGA